MVRLSVNERELLYKFFDISDGYILYGLYRTLGKNKTWTQKIIKEVTGIDIFEDENYKGLSQQKAIEKIIDERNPQEISDLFKSFFDFINFNRQEYLRVYSRWCYENLFDELSEQVKVLIEKLKNTSINNSKLPSLDIAGLNSLEKDLRKKLENNEYDLALDRLHTYSLYYLEKLCNQNNLIPHKDRNGHLMFDDMLKMLQQFIESNVKLNDFDTTTFDYSKIMFQKYNAVRNNSSYAHPNDVLNNARAEYVVSTVLTLLNYLEILLKESNRMQKYCNCNNSSGYTVVKGDKFLCWWICNDCGKIIDGSQFEEFPF